jgi:GNAT superfamily N-acetyltransferase
MDIRPLVAEDRDSWERLWARYLAYHGIAADHLPDVMWPRIMDPVEPVHALGAFDEGDLLGIAHYIFHRHMWTRGDHCFLSDVFTTEVARRRGVGRALVEAVFDRARAQGAVCVYGMTHTGNVISRPLYDQIAELLDVVVYRKAL